MLKPPSPVTMAAKSSASVFTGRVKVNRLVQVQEYRFFVSAYTLSIKYN